MSENNNNNGAHPGVRSLLAKFENSPSNITSPPSRGRSPVGSGSGPDTPGSARQLSRVRASFVTVEGAIQSTQSSSQGSPLRKTSGPSDESSMFGPQINEQGVESRRENVVSPTPGGQHDGQPGTLDAVAKKDTPPAAVPAVKYEQPAVADNSTPAVNVQEAKKELKPSGEAPPASDIFQKTSAKTVTKRPSNIHSSNANAPSKASSTTASTTTKQAASSNARSTATKESTKERTSTLATKTSRASLNPAAKSTTRTTRGSTTAQDASKSSPPSNKTRAKSPTKPVRLPSSMTAPTQASAARLGTSAPSAGRTATSGSTLTRKPSSLKSPAPTQARSAAGATSGVRRQASRPSLPTQPASERPSSRVSDGGSSTKPVNEGFLARMMRPTASSASKSQDKTEAKPPQKTSTSPKAPRQSLAKAPERSAAPPKMKTAPLKPQTEKRQATKKQTAPRKESEEVKPPVQANESEKENIEVSPSVPASQQTVVEEPEKEIPAKPTADDTNEEKVEAKEVEPAAETAPEPIEEPVVQPSQESVAEPAAEPIPEVTEPEPTTEKPVEPAEPKESLTAEPKEPLVQEKATLDGAADVPVVEELEAPKETSAPAVTEPEAKEAEEISVEVPIEPKTGDVPADDQPETSTEGYSTPLLDLNAIVDQEETPKPVVGEASESDPSAALVDTSDETAEPLKDINIPAPSAQPEEESSAKEPTSTEKPAAETESKTTADEIDFQSLTLT